MSVHDVSIAEKIIANWQYIKAKHTAPENYERAIKKWFRRCTGRELNLEEPKTYCDKVNWLKIHGNIPLMTKLADKYLVRDWVREKIGSDYLIPLLGVWDRFDDIDFQSLPHQFALKTNHGTQTNVIIRDKDKIDIKAMKRQFDRWMKKDYAFDFGFEMQYHDIPRKIIAEEYIENNGNNLFDYKIHCFSGKPTYIEYIGDRETEPREIYMDTNWKAQEFYDAVYPKYDSLPAKPHRLGELLHIAKELSSGFEYVRVDLYLLDNEEIKFGEMTFTPGSGQYNWRPESADIDLGADINLKLIASESNDGK